MSNLPRRLSKPGPLIEYIAELQKHPETRQTATKVTDAIRAVMKTDDGAMLLDLLEKSILFRSISVDADPRALDANNAQGFIALDLRRIMSDEFDVKQNNEVSTTTRTSGRRNR